PHIASLPLHDALPISVAMLRYQPSLSASLESPLTRYLTQPLVPIPMGYDQLLQFVLAGDAVAALEAVVRRPVPGPVNVAGEGSIDRKSTRLNSSHVAI